MKVYRFVRSGEQVDVLVNGQPLVLKRRRNEPEQFPSPDRIGFSVLADCVGDSAALLHGGLFQREVVDCCEAGQEISSDGIKEWNDDKCGVGASVQSAVWRRDETWPPASGGNYLRLPRLLRLRRDVGGPRSHRSAGSRTDGED
jgi:hypothetical protein